MFAKMLINLSRKGEDQVVIRGKMNVKNELTSDGIILRNIRNFGV